MNEFLIAFRECLEAALIVGIIYAVLDRNNFHAQKRMLWMSVISAVVASALLGVLLYNILEEAGDGIKALLESLFMYITAGLLFYVIFWMSKTLTSRQAITDQTNLALSERGKWGIFLMVFFAILREGFETALFLVASTSIDSDFSFVGFFGGIILAVLIGYLIVVQGKKIQLRPFFKYTSLLLVFFAAGMIAYGTHELHEYAEYKEHIELAIENQEQTISSNDALSEEQKELMEEMSEEEYVYNIFPPKTSDDHPSKFWYKQEGEFYIHHLNDNGNVGSFFKGLFGYNSNPILIEVILWFAALIFGLIIWRKAYK
ncbi:MAG: FTR1 family protein [Chitinophagales bacterium]